MDDLSEQEKWEEVKRGIREYGPAALAGIALALLGLVGWRWWQARTDRLELDAAARYEQALAAFDAGDRTRAIGLVDALERDYARSPYADQADLAAARAYVDSNELDAAAARLRWVVQNSRDPELTSIARMRLARVQIAAGKPDDALTTLATPQTGAFAYRYHEVLGDAYYAKGDMTAALREYRAARALAPTQFAQNDELNLKINDLTSETPHAPATAAVAK